MKQLLTIAGSDSGGGAGIQADLKTFAALGMYGTSAITALTAQNTCGVRGVHEVPAEFVAEQIDAVLADFEISGVKTGMLASAAIVEAVAGRLEPIAGQIPIVVDPVMVSTTRAQLLQSNAVSALRERLIPLATLITPNYFEAEILCSGDGNRLTSSALAAQLAKLGAGAVVVTGGDLDGDEAIDVLCHGDEIIELAAPRIESDNSHGTGCTFAAAATAYLASGNDIRNAVKKAKSFITEAIRHGIAVGNGKGPTNPFHSILENEV